MLEAAALEAPAARPSPSPPSPSSRAALAYLKQSGCAAISIVEVDGRVRMKTGAKPGALAVYWSDDQTGSAGRLALRFS
jgi:hypothetical protein